MYDILIPPVWLSMNRVLDFKFFKKDMQQATEAHCIAQGSVVNIL